MESMDRPSVGTMINRYKKDFMQHVKVELRRRQYAMTRAELRRFKDMRARKRRSRERYNQTHRQAQSGKVKT
jgi:hypothetical protein